MFRLMVTLKYLGVILMLAVVGFLRKYIGFSGEDLVEKERLKALTVAISQRTKSESFNNWLMVA
tara:strand:- start:22 stop:213 length:192 start_codon:yes stop_codon:yes gene_type:complete